MSRRPARDRSSRAESVGSRKIEPARAGRRRRGALAGVALLSLLLAAWQVSVRRAPTGSGQTGATASGVGTERGGVDPIPWPDLEGLGEADRIQLQGQREVLASAEGQPDTTIGFEQGISGQMLLAYGFDEAAGVAFANARRLQPEEPRWPYFLGIIAQDAGDPETAAAHFERVLDLAPDALAARVHLAEALRAQERQADADALLAEVIDVSGDHPTANFLLGLSALDRGDASSAAERFEIVLDGQPGASSVYNPLAQAYRQLGRTSAAEAALAKRGSGPVRLDDPWMREVIGMRREATAILSQGSQLAQQGRLDEALAVFERAVEADPESASAQLSRASTLADLGRDADAVAAFHEALALDPSSRQSRVGLAIVLDRIGETDAALAQLDAALALDARDLPANQWKGMLLRRQGRCDAAIPALEAALAGDERDVTSRLNVIVCRVRIGDQAAALQAAEQGHQLMSDNAALAAALARLLSASADPTLRDGSRALELADGLVAAQRSVDALEVRAMALAELGRFDEAAQAQSEAIELATGQSDRAALIEWMRSQLARYASGEPSRAPWPPSLSGPTTREG